MTAAEALKNYYRDLRHMIHVSEGDVFQINSFTEGTPYFNSIDEAWDYFRELEELISKEGIPK